MGSFFAPIASLDYDTHTHKHNTLNYFLQTTHRNDLAFSRNPTPFRSVSLLSLRCQLQNMFTDVTFEPLKEVVKDHHFYSMNCNIKHRPYFTKDLGSRT